MKLISSHELLGKIELAAGSIASLEKRSRAQTDGDGCCARIQVLPGLSVVWINNPNYQGGKRNGFGPGLYAIGSLSKCMSNTWLLRQA
jgi:hypothetical protein